MENNHLIELLQDHPDLTEKVLQASSHEEALELVKSIDAGYTLESLKKDLDELTTSSEKEEALNLDQLDKVAGGISLTSGRIMDQMRDLQAQLKAAKGRHGM